MIRNVLYKLGSLRSALAVGVGLPFLLAASALAQVGSTAPTPAAPAATPATESGTGAIADSAPGVDAAAQSNTATAERVIVTGSYIPTAETESALPVTVYTATVLQKQGANTPAEGLRQLPSFVGNAATENDSNGGNGSATINLRALGSGNTLVLINNRRAFLGSTSVNGAPDVNAIPLGALSRSEILKDGASAIYGSDAVAGVVNFILLNGPGEAPYEGAELDLYYGNTTEKDARVLQTYIKGGVATDKVSIAAAAQYYDRESIFSVDRRISETADTRTHGDLGLGGRNTGSPTFPGALTTDSQGNRILIDPSALPDDPSDYRGYLGANSSDPFQFRRTTPAIPAQIRYQTYVTGRVKIFDEALQVYGDMLYAKTKQDNGLAASPFALFADPNGFVNEDGDFIKTGGFGAADEVGGSPYNFFGEDLSFVRYRTIRELGLRQSFFDSDYYRYVVGANGNFTFTDNNFISFLGYDTGVVYERGDFIRVDQGDARLSFIVGETLAGNFNPFVGLNGPLSGTAPTFTPGGVDVDGNALPAIPTGDSQAYDNVAAAQRAAYTGRSTNLQKDFLADVKVFGNLFPNLYQGGIGFNLGYEFRHSRTKSIPDPVQAGGDQLGFNAAANNYFHQEVNSYFGELQIPLVVSTMNIPGVRSLDVAIAYRYEEFDNKDQFGAVDPVTGVGLGKRTSTFDNNGDVRISLRYQPIQDITLRATFGESFLSPIPVQLFDPVQQNFPQLFDPAAVNPPTPGDPNPAPGRTLQPINGVQQGGNIFLTPETTESYTAGLVITPRFLPGFTATVDFYQLFTRNVILGSAQFAQLALTQNGNFIVGGGSPANAPFADVITRNNSEVTAISAQSANAGKRLVQGMDVTAAYQLPWTTFGTFTLSTGYNYFFIWKAEPVEGVGTHSFLGDYNNGSLPLAPGALPYHKGFIRGEYEWKGFDFVATTNYISSFNDDSSFVLGNRDVLDANGEPTPVLVVGGTATDPQYNYYRRVSDYITLDMQLSYSFVKPEAEAAAAAGYSKDAKDAKSAMTQVAGVENTGSFFQRMLWGTTIRVGVNNAFDRTPPTVLGAFNDNYDTSLYSIRNRFYYVGINKKF